MSPERVSVGEEGEGHSMLMEQKQKIVECRCWKFRQHMFCCIELQEIEGSRLPVTRTASANQNVRNNVPRE